MCLDLLLIPRHGTIIVEEVSNFKQYLEEFGKKLVGLGNSVRASMLDAKIWLDWARPRTICCAILHA